MLDAYSPTITAVPLRQSWQTSTKTKFREHLSFISTRSNSLKGMKSIFSPITPIDDDAQRLFRPSSPPPPLPDIPIMPLVQLPLAAAVATHQRATEQDRDPDRTFNVQRAREEAAAKLEKNSLDRRLQEERERQVREREHEYEMKRQEFLAGRVKSGWDDTTTGHHDVEKANGRSINPAKTFSSKLLRLSRAVFKPSTPAMEPSAPFPTSDDEHVYDDRPQDGDSRVTSWLAYIPGRASHLHPWSPLHVQKNPHSRAPSEAGGAIHHHYYGSQAGTPAEISLPISNAEAYSLESAHLEGRHKGKGRRNERCPACREEMERAKRRRSRWWLTCLIILLLLIIGNVIFINLYIVPKSRKGLTGGSNNTTTSSNATLTSSAAPGTPPTTTAPAPTATASTVSPALQSCLTQFVAATNNPSSFSCSTCLPLLTSVPNDLSPDLTSTPPAQGVGNALQFCALNAINAALPSNNSAGLTAVGWLSTTKVCGWSGVSCDSKGRVQSLQLEPPSLPQSLPTEIQYLVALQELNIAGTGQIPGGPITPLLSIQTLTSLSLVQTGISGSFTGLELSTSFPAMTQLLLHDNVDIQLSGPTLGGITQMGNLTQLSMNLQPLPSTTLDVLTNTGNNTPIPLSKTLTTLNLQNTGLVGVVSAGLAQGLPNLVELHLDLNALESLPSGNDNGVIFPKGLKTLTVAGNTGMTGSLSDAQCAAFASSSIQTCDFSGTSVTVVDAANAGGCGRCQLSIQPTASTTTVSPV